MIRVRGDRSQVGKISVVTQNQWRTQQDADSSWHFQTDDLKYKPKAWTLGTFSEPIKLTFIFQSCVFRFRTAAVCVRMKFEHFFLMSYRISARSRSKLKYPEQAASRWLRWCRRDGYFPLVRASAQAYWDLAERVTATEKARCAFLTPDTDWFRQVTSQEFSL